MTADEHLVADGNGVAIVLSQAVDAVCSGGNAWRQLRLGCSFAVCPEAFFLSERRFVQAPRRGVFFFHDRVVAGPTYFFTWKPTYLTSVSSGCCVLTGQVAWRPASSKRDRLLEHTRQVERRQEEEPEDRSQEEGSHKEGV